MTHYAHGRGKRPVRSVEQRLDPAGRAVEGQGFAGWRAGDHLGSVPDSAGL